MTGPAADSPPSPGAEGGVPAGAENFKHSRGAPERSAPAMTPRSGRLHHTEIWVRNLPQAKSTIGWLLESLGYTPGEVWAAGISYRGAHDYIVIESGTDVLDRPHERCAPGINHLAFCAGSREQVDALVAEALARGFTLMFADLHPFAGGPRHYAAYLTDPDGFEFELVAED